MYCTKCGRKAAPGDAYCAACGTRLRTEGEIQNRRRRTYRILTWCIGGAILVAALIPVFVKKPAEPEIQLPPPVSEEVRLPTTPPETTEEPAWTETAAAQSQPTEPTDIPVSSAALYLTEETRVENGITTKLRYAYDEEGRLVRKDTGDGCVHTYSYRPDGTLEKEGLARDGAPVSVILCDTRGNPQKESDLEGDVREYENTYDHENRLVSSQKRAASGELLEEKQYTYAVDGSYTLDCIDHAEGLLYCNVHMEYDSQGRLLKQYQNLESGLPVLYMTENTYDAFGNPEKTVYTCENDEMQIHRVTEYLNTIDENGLLVSTEVYVTANQCIRGETMDFPRALDRKILYTYDDQFRKLSEEHHGPNGWEYTCRWEYDEWGNVTGYIEGDGNVTVSYTYLPLEQAQAG